MSSENEDPKALKEEITKKRRELNKTKEALQVSQQELEELKDEFVKLKTQHKTLHKKVKTMTLETEKLRQVIVETVEEETKEDEEEEIEEGEGKIVSKAFSTQGIMVLFVNLVQLMFWLIVLCYYVSYFFSSTYLFGTPFRARTVFAILILIFLPITLICGVINVVLGFVSGVYTLKNNHEKSTLYSLLTVVLSFVTIISMTIILLTSFVLTCNAIAEGLKIETDVVFLLTHLGFFCFSFVSLFWICYGVSMLKAEYKLLQAQITEFFNKHM